MFWLVESAAYGKEIQEEIYGEYCRVWPEFVRFAKRRKTRNTILIVLGLLGLLPLMGLLPFHIWFLFLAFPPLFLIFPVFLLWGLATWPRKKVFYKKILLVVPGEELVTVLLGEREMVLCGKGTEMVRGYDSLKKFVRTDRACHLFWDDGKLTPLPLCDFLQGDPAGLAKLLDGNSAY